MQPWTITITTATHRIEFSALSIFIFENRENISILMVARSSKPQYENISV